MRDLDRLTLTIAGHTEVFAGTDARRLSVAPGLFRASLIVTGTDARRLKGLRRRETAEVRSAIAGVAARGEIGPRLALAAERQVAFDSLIRTHLADQRWIAYDVAERILAGLPSTADLLAKLGSTDRSDLSAHLVER